MSTLLEYKCPNCGGAISFDSDEQQMKCPYCESTFDVETLKKYDEELRSTPEDKMDWDSYGEESGSGDWREGERDGMVVYSCTSCGGEIVGDENTAATFCPYCGSTVVVGGKLSGSLRPDLVIPFKLDKNAAKAALEGFMKGKPLLPKSFKSRNRIESITGIYVPFWLFDCDTDASIRYKATRTTAWSDSKYNYIKTDYFSLLREGTVGFERVPVDGSTKMEDAYMESIEPFDYSAAVDFQTAYLAGYLADKYDVSSEDCAPRANERIKVSTEQIFASSAKGYVTCVPENTSIRFKRGDIRYALLPVWMLNTKYNGKIYSFAMNGQTGKLVGELPVDRGRFWAWFGGITAGVCAVGAAVAALLFM